MLLTPCIGTTILSLFFFCSIEHLTAQEAPLSNLSQKDALRYMARGDENGGGATTSTTSTKHHSAPQLESSMTTLDPQRNSFELVLTFSRKCLASLLLVALVAAVYVVWTNEGVIKDGRTTIITRTPHYIHTHDKFITKHKRPSNKNDTCNCLNSNAQKENCCQRTIYRLHKMGTILLGDLFQHFRHDRNHLIRTKHVPWNTRFATDRDYRHVIVTRNWFDAIVSGYLYHFAGYECWIDFRGNEREFNRTDDWDLHLLYHEEYDIAYPPRNNRSLCSYLQQESQEDGIKVIIDIALSWWYKGVIPYYRQAQEQLERKSLFLCFEHLVNPLDQEEVFHHMLQHFFPGQNTSSMDMPPKMKQLLLQQQQNHSVYQGAHASTHDAQLRAKLRDFVVRYDQELFNNTVAASNAVFNCG